MPPETVLLVSSASGVLTDFPSHLKRLRADVLVITPEHALLAGALPLHRRDPFDRMLVARVQHEGVPVITNDEAFSGYAVERLW